MARDMPTFKKKRFKDQQTAEVIPIRPFLLFLQTERYKIAFTFAVGDQNWSWGYQVCWLPPINAK